MRTEDAINWAGGKQELADKLGIWLQNVYRWGDCPPMLRQYEIEKLSNGKLKVTNNDRQNT